MLSILINAYACSPNMGSEPGMAWNWCMHLAEYCELHIITEGEFKDNIEAALLTLPNGKNMHFYYNPVSDKIRRICWNQGDWRFYYYYQKWQKKTLKIAQQIINDNHIDIVHQLNMIGFREPGYLWKIKGKPFIWGPTNAKEKFPIAYLQGATFKNKLFIFTKNTLNIFQLRNSHRVKKAIKLANFVVAASSDSANAFKKHHGCKAILINESGCDITPEITHQSNTNDGLFHILWVGRFIFTKQLLLALDTIASLNNQEVRLHIVGGSYEEENIYKHIANKKGIEHLCIWHSKISHEEVQKLMQQSDLFFFTSITEGTPHVVLEAFSNNLPVLCFNTCGHGDCVDEKVGVKINLTNYNQSVIDFGEEINKLMVNRSLLKTLSQNCIQHQKKLSWNNKAIQMIELYKKAILTKRDT